MYDLIIIGAGPAGITAAIYAARKRMNFCVITENIGGQAALSGDVENYTGYQFITGAELAQKFKEHLKQFDIELREFEKVIKVQKEEKFIIVETNIQKYLSKTVIICSGRISKKLNVEGEEKFKNRGISYCATCDAPLFGGKDVAVIGGGNSGLDAVLQLINIANKIYLIESASLLKADRIMVEKAKASNKVSVLTNTLVKKIEGDKFVNEIIVENFGQLQKISVGGVFIEIGYIPVSDFVVGVSKNEYGEIMVNSRCETNVPGIFAAGDVTDVFSKQIIVACGEGAKACIAAFEYLNKS